MKEDLGQVVVKLLDLLVCRSDGSMSVQSYAAVVEWVELMVGKVVDGECHHSGALMCIFRVGPWLCRRLSADGSRGSPR